MKISLRPTLSLPNSRVIDIIASLAIINALPQCLTPTRVESGGRSLRYDTTADFTHEYQIARDTIDE